MDVSFCVLGSGSRGNATLIRTPQGEVLIDAGFPPDEIAARLAQAGTSWKMLKGVILTHTHNDHLYRRCLNELFTHRIPLFCHRSHLPQISGGTKCLKHLREADLIRTFGSRTSFAIVPTLRFSPLPLPHDCPPTFGFCIQATDAAGRTWNLAYLADLGHCTPNLLEKIRGVDLLALEFNHDEEMERHSRRPRSLIDRVLGPQGHLSNRQAAEVLEQLLSSGPDTGPKRLVQLHLSEECNDRRLAYQAAREVVSRLGARTEIFSSHQHRTGSLHVLR